MKKTILVSIALLSLSIGVSAQKIKGSDTVLPLSQKEAESFMKANPSRTVTVTGEEVELVYLRFWQELPISHKLQEKLNSRRDSS